MRTLVLPGLLALLMLAAGCVSEVPNNLANPSDPNSGSNAVPSSNAVGTVSGTVTDDEHRPIHGASVRHAASNQTATSDAQGAYTLQSVPEGASTVHVSVLGFAGQEQEVMVQPGTTVTVDFALEPLASVEPYSRLFVFDGTYDCAFEAVILTGDCLILYESQVGEPDPVTEEEFAFRLPIEPGWEGVVLEMTWTVAGNNQLEGMRLYLEHGNGTETGHSVKTARIDGPDSPLRLDVDRGAPHPSADTYPETTTQAQIPDEGEEAQVRAFPRGNLYEHTSQVCDADGRCLLGIGVGLDVSFTIYATVFYNQGAPDGYSAIPT